MRTQLRRTIAHVLTVCATRSKNLVFAGIRALPGIMLHKVSEMYFQSFRIFHPCQHAVMRHAQSSVGCLPLFDRSVYNLLSDDTLATSGGKRSTLWSSLETLWRVSARLQLEGRCIV